MREYRYRADRDGRVFHDGTEIVDPATLRFLLLALYAGATTEEAHRARHWGLRRLCAR